MYYQECENLANEQPLIRNIVSKIDEIINNVSYSGIYNPSDVANIIDENAMQVNIIFEELKNYKLLRTEEYVECSECKSLMPFSNYKTAINEEDIFECTQCQFDLTKKKQNKVIRYRLNVSKKYDESKTKKISKKLSKNIKFDESLNKKFLNDPFKYTPLLSYYSRSLLKNEPLKNCRAIIILHFLKDFIPFMKALEVLGLSISNSFFFYKEYPYPQREAIINWLDRQKAYVKPLKGLNNFLSTLKNDSKEVEKIIILEDGGFVVPSIHRDYPNILSNVIGAIEQTKRGIWNTEKWLKEDVNNKLQFPVVSVATSKLKCEFEPRYIGKAVIKNIEKMLPNLILSGKNVGLFGYGSIGKEIANWFKNNNSIISVFDSDNNKLLAANQDGYHISSSAIENTAAKNINSMEIIIARFMVPSFLVINYFLINCFLILLY